MVETVKKWLYRFSLIICIALISVVQIVWAADKQELKVYNTRLVTSDKNATFIEGEVPASCGQTLVLKAGLRTIAEKVMPDTGRSARFKIKVPSKNISDERVSVLYIEERGQNRSTKDSVRVELEYKEKQEQTITTDNKDYKMTFPGLDSKIKAKSTSGEKLIFSSSNPDVAEVDENGNLIAKGGGETKISVKQIGSSAYEGTEETINVSVESIDAYTVTYHSSISEDKDETSKQIIETAKTGTLEAIPFENGEHKFLGWATEDGGLVEYKDEESVKDLAAKGENADLYAVWTGDGAPAAVAWAIDIANDNSFAYGTGAACHRIGCYFCGTNQRNKPKGYEKTYVCLTFIGAAYAHGAEDPEILAADRGNKMPMYENNDNFSKFSCWEKVGSCSSLSIGDLKPGDVLISWAANNDVGHVCMYVGGDSLVEAASEGWGAKSIAVNSGAARRLRSYGNSSKNYVMRYKGTSQ